MFNYLLTIIYPTIPGFRGLPYHCK